MKKVLVATLLCTSFFGVNMATTKAATCPLSQQGVSNNLNSINCDNANPILSKFSNANFQNIQSTCPASQQGVSNHLKSIHLNNMNDILSKLSNGKVQNTHMNKKDNAGQKQYPVVVNPATVPAPAQPKAPAPQAPATGLSQDEQQMVNLVNQERQKQGIAPLKVNMQLEKLARLKAQDMIDKNYFSHQSPTYGSPFDMMNQFGVSYQTAGENIAGNQTVEQAHTALMNSAGHRANILNPSFTEVGIGIVDGGPYGKMFVQMFKG